MLPEGPRCFSGTRGQAPAACPSSPYPPPPLTPPGEGPWEEDAAPTCDGHVADALLVHGGHQDHGLRRHHHGRRERLKHTEHGHGVRGHATRKTSSCSLAPKRPGRDSTAPGAPSQKPRCGAAAAPALLCGGPRGMARPHGVVSLQHHGCDVATGHAGREAGLRTGSRAGAQSPGRSVAQGAAMPPVHVKTAVGAHRETLTRSRTEAGTCLQQPRGARTEKRNETAERVPGPHGPRTSAATGTRAGTFYKKTLKQ